MKNRFPIIRLVIIVSMLLFTAWLFSLWKSNYDSLHPEIVEARTYSHVIRQPLKGVLLWRERIISSPANGNVSYLSGESVNRVARGEVVALIRGSRGTFEVKASSPGYFIPALDGKEGQWEYPELWKGSARLPLANDLSWIKNNSIVREGSALGKLIPFPQELRCVGYVDYHDEIREDFKDGVIRIQTSVSDLPLESGLRAVKYYGPKVKIYLTLPFFPEDIIKCRNVDYFIYSGEKAGVVIPESSVVFKDGKSGVFKIDGNHVYYTEIEGMPVSEGMFFIKKGLKPGNLVLLKGSEAKEGRINIW